MKRLRKEHTEVTEKLVAAGLRPTRQRILLGALLFTHKCRHVTAEALHNEAKSKNIKASLATVYNTLHQFTESGLLKHISVDGGCSYFDTNVGAHHHFLNEDTGELIDIMSDPIRISGIPNAPAGTLVKSMELIVRVKRHGPSFALAKL